MFTNTNWVTKTLAAGFLGLLAYLPFHALISTWAISNFGHATIFKSAKELFLLGILFPLCLYLLLKEPKILKKIWRQPINKLIFGYTLLNSLLVFFVHNSHKSEIAGLVLNLRFFAMFLLAQILIEILPHKNLKSAALKIVFLGGLAVVVFGSLQVLILPNDFLSHFGYGSHTIPSYFTVADNNEYIRILSTLRGPNALGAYLVFWLPFLAFITKYNWHVSMKYRLTIGVIWGLSLVTLYGTHSRSGLVGSIIALVVFTVLSVNQKRRKEILFILITICSASLIYFAFNWNSNFVQTFLVHQNPAEKGAINSSEQHQSSLVHALYSIKEHPFGAGTGSTNIASTYSKHPDIVEDYYLQVSVELGLIGLLLFMAILTLTALKLWGHRKEEAVVALISGFAGLLVVNLMLPAWGDETLSMLWWGMAGLFVFVPLVKTGKKRAKL